MKKDRKKPYNSSEDDVLGVQKDRLSEDEEWRVDDFRRQAEKKANLTASRRRPNRTRVNEDAPELQEFSDTQKMSLHRLKPEIRLTSVEPSIRDDSEYNSEEYAADLYEGYEDTFDYGGADYQPQDSYADTGFEKAYNNSYDEAYEEEYEDDVYEDEYDDAYEDDGYADAYEEEYDDEAYEDDEYDDGAYEEDEYDEAYEEEYEDDTAYTTGYDEEQAEFEQENPTQPVNKDRWQVDDYDYDNDNDYDYEGSRDLDELTEDYEPEKEAKSKKNLVIGAVCAVIVLALIGIIIWAMNRGGQAPVANESSIAYQTQQVTGVVTGIDKNNEAILIYNAAAGKEESLIVKSLKKDSINLGNLSVGDVVEVEYQVGDGKLVTKISEAKEAKRLQSVKNAVPRAGSVEIDGTVYSLDDKLVCMYQGQAFDVKKITENTTYMAIAVENHIYTIVISSATGSLKLDNVNEYVDAIMTLTPSSGDKVEVRITKDMDPIELAEGSIQIQIKKEDKILYSGKIFISVGKENTLRLPSVTDEKGKVVFTSNIDAKITVLIDGKEYAGSDEVELAYGDYTAVFSAPGYESVEQKITISQPYQQISVEFKANSTQVTISASLWGVSLYVDGVYQGELEGNSLSCRLAPGSHAITCTRTGYYDQHQTIVITEGMEDQMLYFSGFVAIEQEEASTTEPPQESSAENSETSEDPGESSLPEESSKNSESSEGE